MKRSLGRNWGRAACALACLLLNQGGAEAQQPEQHWQASQNYPANNPPNYQPSTAPNQSAAGSPAPGQYPAGQYSPGQNSAGQSQYPQQSNPPAGQQQYLQQYPQQYQQYQSEPRQPAPAGQQGYGNQQGDNPAARPQQYQYPQVQIVPGQGPPAASQAMQGPPVRNDAPKAPFVLSPPEATALENLLRDWEKRNKEINVMESKFYRWKYDAVFGDGKQPPYEVGELKFAAPDKGLMKIEAKDPKQSEQWLCDGKSIYQFDYPRRLVTEYVMPLELQGKGIGDGPLPFVFGIEAEKLKQRYFMRIITSPSEQNTSVWLEAYPRYQQQAAEFSKVEVILKTGGPTHALAPFAINIYAPNGKDHVVYQLWDPVINPPGGYIPQIFRDWTKVSIPFGWTKKTELPPPPVQAGLTPSAPPRRY
jgi:TIGR03009 family protein